MDKLIKHFTREFMICMHCMFPECSKKMEKRVDGNVIILDLKDVGITKLMGGDLMTFGKKMSQIGQDYFPEMLGKMYILNAPWTFAAGWNLAKVWLDEGTKKKISIIGSGWKKELHADIDPQYLPDFLGGEQTKDICTALPGQPWIQYEDWCRGRREWFPDEVVKGDPMKYKDRKRKIGSIWEANVQEDADTKQYRSRISMVYSMRNVQCSKQVTNENLFRNAFHTELTKDQGFDSFVVEDSDDDSKSEKYFGYSPKKGDDLSKKPEANHTSDTKRVSGKIIQPRCEDDDEALLTSTRNWNKQSKTLVNYQSTENQLNSGVTMRSNGARRTIGVDGGLLQKQLIKLTTKSRYSKVRTKPFTNFQLKVQNCGFDCFDLYDDYEYQNTDEFDGFYHATIKTTNTSLVNLEGGSKFQSRINSLANSFYK